MAALGFAANWSGVGAYVESLRSRFAAMPLPAQAARPVGAGRQQFPVGEMV